MSAAIKPEIYISWIPTGKIGLKPQIYATIIQAPIHEKISADTNRKLSNPESTHGDLQRKIGNGEKISADVYRHVFSTDTVIADTERKLSVEEKISGDTLKKIVQSDEIHADTSRNVQTSLKVIGDTSRKIGVTTIRADLQRRVNVTTKTDGDTCRRVEVEEKISGDLALKITCAEIVHADTYRKVEDPTPTTAGADTNRKIGVREKISANTRRLIAERESAIADILLQTATTEKVIADTMRGLREVFRADTLRKVTRAERAVAKTVIRIPHILNYMLQSKTRTLKASPKLLAADNPASLINTFKDYGVTAINITLNEKTLSDTFEFEIASRSMGINEAVQGYLLDYPFSFLVEETNQKDLVQTVKGRYSIDDSLYTWTSIPTERITIDGEEYEVPGGRIEKGRNDKYVFIYPTASEVISRVTQNFGKLSRVSLSTDFTPSNLSGDNMVTYADILNSVFGWTSRLPHMQVNTFIRGETIHCVQRGSEGSVFDITELRHSRPTIIKKFNRVLCNNPNDNDNGDDNDDDNSKLFSGTIMYSGLNFDLRYEYRKGFLQKEYQHFQTGDTLMDDSTGISHPFSTSSDTEWATTSGTNSTTYTYVWYNDLSKSEEDRSEAKTQVQLENLYERYISTKSEKNTSIQTHGTGNVIEDSTKVTTNTVTQYHYSRIKEDTRKYSEIYLVAEIETAHVTEYEVSPDSETHAVWEKVSDEIHVKKTFHTPVGNGWYGQAVFLDGAFQGANLSQGKPGNRVSPYVVEHFGGDHVSTVTGDDAPTENPLGELSAIVDSSFPVRDRNLQTTLQSALRWLHRRTEETATVDLISRIDDGVPEITHIVDFTDRVKLDGAEYFLVSNQISFTPRKLIQKLNLIRWY